MNSSSKLSVPSLQKDGGKMGQLIAKKNWKNHPLGPIESWPKELTASLLTCLSSSLPSAIYWGKELFVFYNDAWSPIFGEDHQKVVGEPAAKAWSTRWGQIKPAVISTINTKKGTLERNLYLPLHKKGFTQECYFDYACTAIYADGKKVEGVLNICHETTGLVLYERRSRTLRRIYEKSFNAESPEAACIHISNVLSEAPYDIPFAMFYLANSDGKSLRLAATTSIDTDNSLANKTVDLAKKQKLPFKEAITSKKIAISGDLKRYKLPGGLWEESSSKAVVLYVNDVRTKENYGVLVLGMSPRLEYDYYYKRYQQQIAEQTAFSVGAAYDLQKKLNLEQREKETRKQLQQSLSSNLVGMWSWDITSGLMYADDNLSRQLGVRKSEKGVTPARFMEAVHPDERRRILKLTRQAVEKKRKFEAEYRIVNYAGEERWVISRGSVEIKDNNAIRLSGITIDITEHKKLEIELATSEHMFSALFQSNIIAVAVASMDGTIIQTNDTFLRMFGYTKRDLKKGMNSKMLTPPGSKGVTSLFYRELRTKGETEPVEKEYKRKDGTLIPTLVGAVRIPENKDRFIAFILDISEQKQLLELNQAKDEFISIASHQLRTPATGVKQYLGMLIEGYVGKVDEPQLKIIKTAYESNERQLNIANDLLRVAQADSSVIKLKPRRINLSKFINETKEDYEELLKIKNQKLRIKGANVPIYSRLDPFHIRMVLDNLVDNASKYTRNDKAITISIESKNGNRIIKVSDQGVGIARKDMPKLFKKFSRIDNPLSTYAGGTGLGLYWAAKIVELHKGDININSKQGKGTEVVITLPSGVS